MKQYIGCKLVAAEPATRVEFRNGVTCIVGENENLQDMIDKCMEKIADIQEGYRVKYADNYESWSPKDVFEGAYLPMEVNPNLKTDKPSISKKMVEDFIAFTETITMGEKTTVVRAVLCNGFEIVESSVCVSKENYDVELGKKICMKKIEDKVWMLLGFLLQTAVGGVQGGTAEKRNCNTCEDRNCAKCEVELNTDLDFGQAIQAAKAGYKIARAGWNGKGQYVELAVDIEYDDQHGERHGAFHEDVGSAALAFVGTRGTQMGWLASQSDMLAEDWMIVE